MLVSCFLVLTTIPLNSLVSCFFTVAPNVRTSAIYYFVAAIFVLLIAFDAYYVLPLTVRFNM